MNREKLIQLAREAGFSVIDGPAEWMRDPNDNNARISVEEYSIGDNLAAFAALVAAHEREACAQACDRASDSYAVGWDEDGDKVAREKSIVAQELADEIRARGKP